jgi:hypothetical protein
MSLVVPSYWWPHQPLRQLVRALDEASAGMGRLVLVSGEPGVGKTSLATVALAEAERRGARTAIGVCWDGAGTPGLWPCADAAGTAISGRTGRMETGGRSGA